MYLSRVILDNRQPATLRLLGDPYAMHRFLWNAFPDGDKPNQAGIRDILWRLEPERDRPPTVLIQSGAEPDWCRPDPVPFLSAPEVKLWEPSFRNGQRVRFRLRANPTRSVPNHDTRPDGRRQRGQRVGLFHEDDQLDWLVERAAKHGFRVSHTMRPTRDPQFRPGDHWFRVEREVTWKTNRPGARDGQMTWLAVDFEGGLEVTDVERFTDALRSGIGSAKAFGFGLLSLARPR